MQVIWIIIAVLALAYLALHLWTRVLTAKAEAAVPQRGKIVPVEGGTIHYVEAGDPGGVPVVLIHGITGQLQHFDFGMIEMLAEEFRVIALDRPGCGYSERESDLWSPLDRQAAMIWAFLDELGAERPVLVGHSLGGAVALAMALQRPEGTGALALLSPVTHVVREFPDIFAPLKTRPDWLRWVVGQSIAAPMGHLTGRKITEAVFAPEAPPDGVELRGGLVLMERAKGFVNGARDAGMLDAALAAQVRRYGELAVPGGVLFAGADALLPPDEHGAAMVQYGLDYEVLEGRGHVIPATAPAECADFVRRMAAKRAR